MSATIRDVMSTRVMTVHRGLPFKAVAALLREQGTSGFPVVDEENRVVGVVSEADLLVKEALRADGSPRRIAGRMRAKADGVTVADLMSTPPATVGPDEPVARAARLMSLRHVRRLPVTDAAGRLIGIVDRAGVLAVYDRSDDEIRREITRDLLQGTFAGDPDRFRVTVENGIVTLAGTPESEAAGTGILDAIGRVDGVVAVRDQLGPPEKSPAVPSNP